MDKEIDKIIDKLQKNYSLALPDVRTAGSVKRLVLSSPQLNYIFGGGFAIGRIAEFFGPESGGKTVLSSYIGGQFQQRTDGGAKTVLYVDMEHAFDYKYASKAGLNIEDNFIFVQPLHGEEGFTVVEELVQSGKIGLIVWDSIASTPSASVMEAEYGKACVSPNTEVMFRVVD